MNVFLTGVALLMLCILLFALPDTGSLPMWRAILAGVALALFVLAFYL